MKRYSVHNSPNAQSEKQPAPPEVYKSQAYNHLIYKQNYKRKLKNLISYQQSKSHQVSPVSSNRMNLHISLNENGYPIDEYNKIKLPNI